MDQCLVNPLHNLQPWNLRKLMPVQSTVMSLKAIVDLTFGSKNQVWMGCNSPRPWFGAVSCTYHQWIRRLCEWASGPRDWRSMQTYAGLPIRNPTLCAWDRNDGASVWIVIWYFVYLRGFRYKVRVWYVCTCMHPDWFVLVYVGSPL